MNSNLFFEQIKRRILTLRGGHMFNMKRKSNPIILMASMLGVGAATYYLTKEAMRGEDRDSKVFNPTETPFDYIRNDF